jgi:hypothetical protein
MAPAVTVQTLEAQVRIESGLRNNQVLSSADIYSFINEGYSDLRDRVIARFAYWFRQEVPFTLTSSSPGNIFDLTTIPDFQMAQGLDFFTSAGVFYSVPMLCSYQERNAFNGSWPFLGQTWGYNGILGRKYWIDGDNLEVLPAQNAAGNYRLVYTPIQTMQPKTSLPFTMGTSSLAANVGGKVFLTFDNGFTVDPQWIGGKITVAFTNGGGTAYNGTYNILPASSGSNVFTDTAWPGGSFTGPSSGTMTVVFQASGTTDTLPPKLIPWSQYVVLYAAIAVRNSRNQDPSALLGRFADIKQRVIDLTKQRSEGIRQAPIANARYGNVSGGGSGF